MSAATFGDLLTPARRHLQAAADFPGSAVHGDSIAAAARATSRLTRTLSSCLGAVAPHGMAEVITSRELHPQTQAAVTAREALRLADDGLRAAATDGGEPGAAPDPLTAHLSAAATALAAGQDLLRGHFTTDPHDRWSTRSNWSAVICSNSITRALTAEVANWSQRLAFITTRLSLASQADPALQGPSRQGLAGASHWLLTAGTLLAAERDDLTIATDTELLHVVPAILGPEPLRRQGPETADELVQGIAASTARLQVIMRAPAADAVWSTELTADSWRWSATGAAVMSHISELTLNTLGERSGLFADGAALGGQLRSSAESAARACACWRQVATAWNEITTETRGLTAPSVADTSDLVVRLGRLAFANPAWTPVRAQRAPLRDPADLAPDAAQARLVLSAIHHTAETLAHVASADMAAVTTASSAWRLFTPTRALPDYYDIPYRHGHATPARVADLLSAYKAASEASDRAVTSLDAAALAMDAPSRILALGRAARHPADDASALDNTADSPRQPAATTASSLDRAAPSTSGPVERAVLELGADEVVLLRAVAMDNAASQLIAQARQDAGESGLLIPAKDNRRTVQPDRTPVQVAASNFPGRPLTPKPRRKTAASPKMPGPQVIAREKAQVRDENLGRGRLSR
jgi:hypothetical protein